MDGQVEIVDAPQVPPAAPEVPNLTAYPATAAPAASIPAPTASKTAIPAPNSAPPALVLTQDLIFRYTAFVAILGIIMLTLWKNPSCDMSKAFLGILGGIALPTSSVLDGAKVMLGMK